MKKFLTLILAISMATAMTACGDDTDDTTADDSVSTEVSTPADDNTDDDSDDNSDDVQATSVRGNVGDFAPVAGDVTATISIEGFGDIKFVLFPEVAPLAVENFVTHAEKGFYEGVIFHRVINEFMIQGGDPTGTGMGGESIWGTEFADEFSDYARNFTGALAMANKGPDTNSSQFFIVNSPAVDADLIREYATGMQVSYTDAEIETYSTDGGAFWLDGAHTVFGQIYEGLDVVQAVMDVELANADAGVPLEAVVISSITIGTYE